MVLLAVALVLGDPIMVSVGSWVPFQRTKSGWDRPAKELKGKEYSWFHIGSTEAPLKLKLVAYDEEQAGVAHLDPPEVMAEGQLYVSGGKYRPVTFTHLMAGCSANQKLADAYAKTKGAKGKTVTVDDAVSGDFNHDGVLDTFIAVSAATAENKVTNSDFAGGFIQTKIGGKVRTIELGFETNYGQMRGPFHYKFAGAGDFDGDGTREFVMTSTDSWGTAAQLMQLSKSGVKKQLCMDGYGE